MTDVEAADIGEITIRAGLEGDYDAMAAVMLACRPTSGWTGADLRHGDESQDAALYYKRFVAERGAELVGYVYAGEQPSAGDGRRFFLAVWVRPESRGKGAGRSLYRAAIDDIAVLKPASILVKVGEFDDESRRFAEARGYKEAMREWESSLDVDEVDIENFEDRLATPAKYGVAVKTYADLAGDPDRDRKLYDLVTQTSADEPSPEPFVPMSFEQWVHGEIGLEGFLPDACFVLVSGEHYLGVSSLFRRGVDGQLEVGYTGVHRKARRRGLAFALKVYGVQYAKEHGYKRITTQNASDNRPMLSINECLGFKKQPADVSMIWRPGGETTVEGQETA